MVSKAIQLEQVQKSNFIAEHRPLIYKPVDFTSAHVLDALAIDEMAHHAEINIESLNGSSFVSSVSQSQSVSVASLHSLKE